MSRFKSNLFANFAGVGWQALLGLVCTPLYIKFMGIEAYGLVGFYIMLQTSLQVLDLGLSPTVNREMARYSVQPGRAGEIRDFARTLGACSWAIGVVIGAAILFAAPLIATRWIKASAIPAHDVQQAVTIMGALVALQWPLSFYQGGLMGLQRQVLLNGLRIAMATLGNGGALLILWRVSPTVTAFFGWQILVSAVQVCVVMTFLGRSLPSAGRAPRFDPALIRNVWRFAAGMSGITVSALILTQLDKVILSKMLSLKMFGYYTLAGVVSSGLYVLISPVFNAIFPRFSALVAAGDHEELKLLYHRGSQLMAVLILPVAFVMVLFPHDIVLLWTGSAETAWNTSSIVSMLAIGTALNGLMNLPYALQLAHGWTRLGLCINTFLIIVLVPSTVFLTMHYGAIGGAAVWVALNSLYTAIGIPFTHRRLLKGEAAPWLLQDVGLPMFASLLVVAAGRNFIAGRPMSPLITVTSLVAVLFFAMATAAMMASEIRLIITSKIRTYL